MNREGTSPSLTPAADRFLPPPVIDKDTNECRRWSCYNSAVLKAAAVAAAEARSRGNELGEERGEVTG